MLLFFSPFGIPSRYLLCYLAFFRQILTFPGSKLIGTGVISCIECWIKLRCDKLNTHSAVGIDLLDQNELSLSR